MKLRVVGRAVQYQEDSGEWRTVKWFRTAAAARRGMARRRRDPTIVAYDILRDIYRLARRKGIRDLKFIPAGGNGRRRAPAGD